MNRWTLLVLVGWLLSACDSDEDPLSCDVDQDCPSKAYVCRDGRCRIGGDECKSDVQCNTPPEPVCVGTDIQIVHESRGTCEGGRCSYPQTVRNCLLCPLCLEGCLLDTDGDGALEDVPATTVKPADACQVCTPDMSLRQWSPRDCGDQSTCTVDRCNAATGCAHSLDTAVACHHLAFGMEPQSVQARHAPWPAFTVRIEKWNDELSDATAAVTVQTLGGTGTLTGTTTVIAVGGVAMFAGLRYDVSETVTLEVQTSRLGVLSRRIAVSEPPLAVSAGSRHNCAVTENGEMWCWGDNDSGQLGDGTYETKASPARVGTATGWTAVTAGDNYTCGLKNGELWCWGIHGYNGGWHVSELPVRVGTDTDWTAVAAGNSHTCAIKNGGELWCWGYNSYGQLGDGSNVSKNTPTRVGIARDWRAVMAGGNHTCGLKNDGTLWCWGSNHSGQLGHGILWVTEPKRIVLQ